MLPPVFDMPGADVPVGMRSAVDHLAYDDEWVPAMPAGSTMDEVGRAVTEEPARGMYEGTAPAAGMRRSFGIYRAERPVPGDASWRERFLALTGRGTLVA